MNLPEPIAAAVQPLFEVYPLDRSLRTLVVHDPLQPEIVAAARDVVHSPAVQAVQSLVAGIWLYVDELDQSHTVSQNLPDPTGAFWHGIMHRREGDFSNSHYWFQRTGAHPAIGEIADYEPRAFIDAVANRTAAEVETLIETQRREWSGLFAWCANHPDA